MRLLFVGAVRLLLVAVALVVGAASALAAGNLAARPDDLEIIMKDDLTFSKYEFKLETGKYYRLTLKNVGTEEFQFRADDFWRNTFINEIKIGDLEIHPLALHDVEFDDEGEMLIFFVPIRPGDYDFWVDGMEERGMKGKFIVR